LFLNSIQKDMTMSKFFILFIASLSLILSSCSTNTKTGNLNTEIVKKNNTTKKNINYYQKCKANITNKTEDFTEENEADIRMNMFCKFLNSKNPNNITIIIGDTPITLAEILDYSEYSYLASKNKLNSNYEKNAQCGFYYEITESKSDQKNQKVIKSKKYICYTKEDKYEDSLINQCYLKGRVIKKVGKEKFIPEEYICPDLESFYKSGREILE